MKNYWCRHFWKREICQETCRFIVQNYLLTFSKLRATFFYSEEAHIACRLLFQVWRDTASVKAGRWYFLRVWLSYEQVWEAVVAGCGAKSPRNFLNVLAKCSNPQYIYRICARVCLCVWVDISTHVYYGHVMMNVTIHGSRLRERRSKWMPRSKYGVSSIGWKRLLLDWIGILVQTALQNTHSELSTCFGHPNMIETTSLIYLINNYICPINQMTNRKIAVEHCICTNFYKLFLRLLISRAIQ